MLTQDYVTIYFDGGVHSNRICVFDEFNNTHKVIYFKRKMTNNELEYEALIQALCYIHIEMADHANIMILGDSRLVINQVTGKWVVNKSHLKILNDVAVQWFRILNNKKKFLGLKWTPRHKNKAGIILEKLIYNETHKR